MPQSPAHQVVLLGAGHAHLLLARHAERFRRRGIGLTLVDPDVFWYSGLATGMLGGMYPSALDRVDAGRLIEAHGGRFVCDRAVGLDPQGRLVRLVSGGELRYDALSLNLGSEVAAAQIPGAVEHAWLVKPIRNLDRLRQMLEQRFRDGSSRPVRLVVIGGGATGGEIAANLDALARRHAAPVQVTLVSRSDRLLRRGTVGASRELERALRDRGVELAMACRVERIASGAVIVAGGQRIEADAVVVATGLRPPALLREWGLAVDQEGGLRVDATLRSVADPRIFGAGDCVHLEGHDLPRLGVFGVRQAPVLLHNLLAMFAGGKMKAYRPQRRYLAILNLGRGEGLAMWGRWHWRGRASLWLKDRIDRRFLARYRVG